MKNNSSDFDELVSAQIRGIMQKSNNEMVPQINPKVTTVDQVYTELIQLRNKNRALEGRIK